MFTNILNLNNLPDTETHLIRSNQSLYYERRMALLLTASTRGYSRGGGGRRSVERVGSFTAHSPLSRYNTTSTSSFQRKKLDLDRCAPYLVLVAASASLVAFGTATGYNYNHLSLCNSSSLLLDTTTNSAVTQCSSVLNDEPSKSGIPQPNDSSPLATMAFASTASFRQEPNPIVFEKNNSMPRTKLRTRDNEKPYDVSSFVNDFHCVHLADALHIGK